MFARFIFLAFYQFILVLLLLFGSASEMTYIVSGGALNSTHSLTITFRPFVQGGSKGLLIIICGPNQWRTAPLRPHIRLAALYKWPLPNY